jgi:tryptophan synthase beta chain
MLHQTIIGQETKLQLAKAGERTPDVVIGCAGGGSNLAGLTFPFVKDKIEGAKIEILAVEPSSCPTLTKGPFAYDIGDMSGMTPLLPCTPSAMSSSRTRSTPAGSVTTAWRPWCPSPSTMA